MLTLQQQIAEKFFTKLAEAGTLCRRYAVSCNCSRERSGRVWLSKIS